MSTKLSVAVVGIGKIARDQHLPAIAASPAFELAATVSRREGVAGVANFGSIEELLDSPLKVDAVALCTPPQGRHGLARLALDRGRHVMLEKPPGATVSEVRDLSALAEKRGVTLFATWHSRFAPAVEAARAWLAGRALRSVRIVWKEDVRHWHPGQEWIWEPGGLGVFDPGINALSIATRILPEPFFLTSGSLSYPANREAPIAASLVFATGAGLPISAEFDWRQTGPQSWDIEVATDAGTLRLREGGSRFEVDGVETECGPEAEYPRLYDRFARLIRDGARSDVDLAPLRHVADAFLASRRVTVEPFD